jgi:predicted unusual protein kinase regulating ubiquinone biosynthesis (AarF/ABC1/UbiB family)
MCTFQVAKALVELFGEMIFVHGFIHGDPHPGNILVSSQGHGNFQLGTSFASELVCFPYLSKITNLLQGVSLMMYIFQRV